MTECIHELRPETCDYCRPRAQRQVAQVVFISPQRIGHLEGCTHKEDDDWQEWGQATAPGAWRDLCNGNPVTADAGSALATVAERACLTCVDSTKNN